MARTLLACAATAALLGGALGFAPGMQPLPRVSTCAVRMRMSVVRGEQQPPQQQPGGDQPSLWRRMRAKWSEGKEGMGKLLLGAGTGALAGFGAPRTASVLQGKDGGFQPCMAWPHMLGSRSIDRSPPPIVSTYTKQQECTRGSRICRRRCET